MWQKACIGSIKKKIRYPWKDITERNLNIHLGYEENAKVVREACALMRVERFNPVFPASPFSIFP